ncbi:hypothetical protein M422DRAFT_262223, partial [Sphaerobolus stellatus SS14]
MLKEKQDAIIVDMPQAPTAIKANVAALQRTFASGQGKEPKELYDPKTALDDLPLVRKALQLFLESKM